MGLREEGDMQSPRNLEYFVRLSVKTFHLLMMDESKNQCLSSMLETLLSPPSDRRPRNNLSSTQPVLQYIWNDKVHPIEKRHHRLKQLLREYNLYQSHGFDQFPAYIIIEESKKNSRFGDLERSINDDHHLKYCVK